jgi:hypothetical protein
MAVELDHVFVCVSRGAPEADALVESGLLEGPRNVHPGQGTANRRFFFRNAMLELLWVEDPAEAQSEQTAPSRLWERWTQRSSSASPFGIIVRPADEASGVPFPARIYKPSWLPSDLEIYVGEAGIEEPMWAFMPFLRRVGPSHFRPHPNGANEITRLTVTAPSLQSAAAAVLSRDVLRTETGPGHLMTIEFDHAQRQHRQDFRPQMPLVFHY